MEKCSIMLATAIIKHISSGISLVFFVERKDISPQHFGVSDVSEAAFIVIY